MAAAQPLRGSSVGAKRPSGPQREDSVDRRMLDFFCARGHATRLAFAVDADIPDTWDCPRCGLPAGLDQQAPPEIPRTEPFKSHLAYVKERRTEADGEALLAEALARVAGRRTPGGGRSDPA